MRAWVFGWLYCRRSALLGYDHGLLSVALGQCLCTQHTDIYSSLHGIMRTGYIPYYSGRLSYGADFRIQCISHEPSDKKYPLKNLDLTSPSC